MVQSLRCKVCKQLKSAERELADLQTINHNQSIELSRSRKQMNQLYNQLKESKDALSEAMKVSSKISTDLSETGGKLHEARSKLKELGIDLDGS